MDESTIWGLAIAGFILTLFILHEIIASATKSKVINRNLIILQRMKELELKKLGVTDREIEITKIFDDAPNQSNMGK